MELFSLPIDIVIPLLVAVIILISVMWVLYYKNRKLYTVLASEEKRFLMYKNGLQKLRDSNYDPEKSFDLLNRFARAFFKEYHQLDYSLTYLELEQIFREKNKDNYSIFCNKMSETGYGGRESMIKNTKLLTDMFYKIITSYEI